MDIMMPHRQSPDTNKFTLASYLAYLKTLNVENMCTFIGTHKEIFVSFSPKEKFEINLKLLVDVMISVAKKCNGNILENRKSIYHELIITALCNHFKTELAEITNFKTLQFLLRKFDSYTRRNIDIVVNMKRCIHNVSQLTSILKYLPACCDNNKDKVLETSVYLLHVLEEFWKEHPATVKQVPPPVSHPPGKLFHHFFKPKQTLPPQPTPSA